MRSLAADKQLSDRKNKEKCIRQISGQKVWIDGFNTIITLEVMLSDSILFQGMDGCIRDLAALRGTYRLIPETEPAVRMMMKQLESAQVKSAGILLDEPVSNSGRLKALYAIWQNLYNSWELYQKENVVTSDAIILDHCRSWVNLTAECLKQYRNSVIRVW